MSMVTTTMILMSGAARCRLDVSELPHLDPSTSSQFKHAVS